MAKLRLGVIFGGRSGEHEVSLVSAASVMNALDPSKYEIIPIGITKEGKWIASDSALRYLRTGEESEKIFEASFLPDPTKSGLNIFVPPLQTHQPLDVVFAVLHGSNGEDGAIQGLFELTNIPFVGAGVLGSALGMDKSIQKEVFRARGLPVTKSMTIHRNEFETNKEAMCDRVSGELSFPCFVKPTNLGSSVGISKAKTIEELRSALELAFQFDRNVIIEAAVPNARELECAVLGNRDAIASIVGEVIPSKEYYDYFDKYESGASKTIVPAEISDTISKKIREMSLVAFHAIGCEGMARVDFLLERDTENLFLNEINTIPGFTSISMYPKLFEASGIPYPELLDRLIALALERHAEKKLLQTNYTPVQKWYASENKT